MKTVKAGNWTLNVMANDIEKSIIGGKWDVESSETRLDMIDRK